MTTYNARSSWEFGGVVVVVASSTCGLSAVILLLAIYTSCQTMPYIEPAYKETPKLTIYGESVAAQTPTAEWGVLARTVAEECSLWRGGNSLAF